MPHMTDTTDILVTTSCFTNYDEARTLTRVLPASRREHSGMIASLWAGVRSILKRPPRRQRHLAASCYPQFETPLDTLAREHPYLYMRALIG